MDGKIKKCENKFPLFCQISRLIPRRDKHFTIIFHRRFFSSEYFGHEALFYQLYVSSTFWR